MAIIAPVYLLIISIVRVKSSTIPSVIDPFEDGKRQMARLMLGNLAYDSWLYLTVTNIHRKGDA